MAKMFKYSLDADVAQLDIFNTPATNTSVHAERYIPIECNDNLDKDKLEWDLSQGGLLYYNLKNIRLNLQCKIVDKNGLPPEENDVVFPVNHLLRSMWKDVEVTMGGKKVSTGSNNYHYKCMMKTLLRSVQNQSMLNEMMPEYFFPDSPGAFDSFNGPQETYNQGLYDRRALTGRGQVFEMEGAIGEDIFDIHNYLINGVKTKISMTRNSNEILLMTPHAEKGFKLKIVKAVLKIPVVDVSPAIITGHDAGFNEGGFGQYFFRQYELQRFSITSHTNKATFHVHNSTLLPNRIAVVFVSNSRYDGNYSLNPFLFHHLNVKNIVATLPNRTVPASTEEYNMDSFVITPLLNSLYDVAPNALINLQNFTLGYGLFVFNLNVLGNKKKLSLQHSGTLKVDVTFRTDLEETYQALILSEFESCLQVDKIRQVEIST